MPHRLEAASPPVRRNGIRLLLNLSDLGTGDIPAITPAVGNSLAEAASVCLESEGHNPGIPLTVRGDKENSYALTWKPASAQAQLSWNDPDDATEKGAVGIAILVAKEELGYSIIRQSWKGTGFDYWMGDKSAEGFINKAGLEISGIRHGDDGAVGARVRQKLRQASRRGNSRLRTYAIVIEFSRPLAEVRENERS